MAALSIIVVVLSVVVLGVLFYVVDTTAAGVTRGAETVVNAIGSLAAGMSYQSTPPAAPATATPAKPSAGKHRPGGDAPR